MNPVLKELLNTRSMITPQGQKLELHSNINQEVGEMLQYWVKEVNCVNSVEVGLAFGVSALFILETLAIKKDACHFGIDPMQFNDRWYGQGLENINQAGYKNIYKFYNETSFMALPKILEAGNRIQFALIDGWHTFDYTLVDFFYADKMLDVDGVVVFDDVGYKAIRKVVTFVLSNLNYELVDGVGSRDGAQQDFKTGIKSKLSILSRSDWTPSLQTKAHFDSLAGMQTVVLRKKSDDTRSFNHFLPF